MALNLHHDAQISSRLKNMTHQEIDVRSAADKTPRMSQEDLTTMAIILESRHGVHAKDMAEFFASMHARQGDAERCWAWGGVANIVEKREQMRMAA